MGEGRTGGKVMMKRTALFLRVDQVHKLETLSKQTMAPVAALIRAAIDEYLSKKGGKQ